MGSSPITGSVGECSPCQREDNRMEIIETRIFTPEPGSGVIGHVREVTRHVPDTDELAVAAALSGDNKVRIIKMVTYDGLWD